MLYRSLSIFCILLVACQSSETTTEALLTIPKDSSDFKVQNELVVQLNREDSLLMESELLQVPDFPEKNSDEIGADMRQNYYVIIADTASNFDTISRRMERLHLLTKIPKAGEQFIYDPKDGLIMPIDSLDEMFSGSYIERRYKGEDLSLEMLHPYIDDISNKDLTMAIIAGLYLDKKEAVKRWITTRKYFPQSQIVISEMYIGCLN